MTLRQALAGGLLTLAGAVGAHADEVGPPGNAPPAGQAPPAVPAPPPPLHAFVEWPGQLKPGAPLRAPGLLLVPLLRDVASQDLVEGARVGLHEVAVDVMDLPAPAGGLYVRLMNRSPHPVEVTVGEALVTPDGPSRIVARPAYLPPGSSAMVPTALGLDLHAVGPYVCRGLGLSPREQGLLDARTWPAELRARNQQLGVEPTRLLDASAGYLTEAFQAQAAAYEARLSPLRGPRCVGVAAFDERGLAFARICGDAARFRDQLVFLERELVLDALRALAGGRRPRDVSDAVVQADVRALLGLLAAPGVARQSFAGAALHRWDVQARNGRWEGLSVEGSPWSLTWRLAPPTPPPAPLPPNPPPTPPQPPVPDEPTPGVVDRDPRPTPFEERWRERRPGGGGGPTGGPVPPPQPRPAGGGGLGGGGPAGGGPAGGGLGGGQGPGGLR